MDRLIKRFDAAKDEDLMLCERRGIAYQRNMARDRIAYDAAYFEHYRALEGSATEVRLNEGRLAMLLRHAAPGTKLLDVGIGSGSFLRSAISVGFEAKGCDVNPVAVEYLKQHDWHAQNARGFEAVTFWDSLEHMENPERFMRRIQRSALVLVALPLIKDVRRVRDSKHYKPGEHLYYWTRDGFVAWMALWGFRLVEESDHEVEAGREQIGAFAFRRDLPDYDDHIAAYREMHATRHYGASATELHLRAVAEVVRKYQPRSILDYGCGRSDLVAHFWLDGSRNIERYDPAIPAFSQKPMGRFELALCCDVMEHIPMAGVDSVLNELRERSGLVFFSISLKPARAKLPDGRNSHVTLLSKSEWQAWLGEYFGPTVELPSSSEYELVALAGRRTAHLRQAA